MSGSLLRLKWNMSVRLAGGKERDDVSYKYSEKHITHLKEKKRAIRLNGKPQPRVIVVERV